MNNKTDQISGDEILKMDNPVFTRVTKEIKDYAIFTMDINGYVMSWNEGARQLKEYEEDEIIGKYYGILFPENVMPEKPKQELEEAHQKGRYEDKNWRRKKSGDLFWAHVVLTAIHDEDGEVKGFIKITQDLTKEKKIEEALFKKNESLIKANADLDNFVYTASHDLKSPVNNMEGLLNYITPELEPEKLKQMLDYLRLSVEKLKSTITELSSVAKMNHEIETGQVVEISVKEVVDDLNYFLSRDIQKECPHIETDIQVETIYFSRLNLKSIIFNLISNSIKYRSPERLCKIKLSSYTENNQFVLKVTDNGLGMPEGYQQKIFKMFSRMHQHPDGTGIGLYILKRIVDNAGGTIDILSEVEKGTTIKITLPDVLSAEGAKRQA